MSSKCKVCGCDLTSDEIAITRKLVNRGATEFYCVRCLAEKFKITPDDVKGLIQRFREAGCSLFT